MKVSVSIRSACCYRDVRLCARGSVCTWNLCQRTRSWGYCFVCHKYAHLNRWIVSARIPWHVHIVCERGFVIPTSPASVLPPISLPFIPPAYIFPCVPTGVHLVISVDLAKAEAYQRKQRPSLFPLEQVSYGSASQSNQSTCGYCHVADCAPKLKPTVVLYFTIFFILPCLAKNH